MACTSLDSQSYKCVDDTDGALVIAALYNLGDHGQLDSSSASGIISNIVSYGFTVATIQCTQSFFVDQEITVECDNPIIGEAVSNNSNCVRCKEIVQTIIDNRAKLDEDAMKQNPKYIPTEPLQTAVNVVNGHLENHNDGVCQYVCMQCIAQNVKQNTRMTVEADCDTVAQSYITAFTTGMSYQAEFELTKHQNALKNAGFAITKQDDLTSLAVQLSDTIIQMTLNKSLNSLNQNALSIQRTRISPGSTSVVLQNIEQSMSISMFTSLASATYNDTVMKNAVNYNVLVKQIEIETNFNDLIKDLDATVHTMDDLLISLVGKVLITIIALLATALVIFAGFFYFRFISFGGSDNIDPMHSLPSTDHQQILK